MVLTIFYAWQSDTHRKANHAFIHEALDEAITSLNARAVVEEAIRLDHDTKGKTGTPHVADTILEKIRNCGIFVADLTCVAKTRFRTVKSKRRRKRVPNPNVMLETGYASASIPWDQIILVMNTAFGGPEHLPFDLKYRRHPIQYDLPHAPGHAPDPAKALKVKAGLGDIFKTAIGDIITSGVTGRRAEEAARVAAEAAQRREVDVVKQRANFEAEVTKNKYRMFRADRGIATVSIFPMIPPVTELGLGESFLRKRFDTLRPMRADGGDYVPTNRSLICRYLKVNPVEDRALTELTMDGSLFAVDHWTDNSAESSNRDVVIQFPMFIHEAELLRAIYRYLRLLKELSVKGPWWVGISLLKFYNYQLVASKLAQQTGRLGAPYEEEDIITKSVLIPDEFDAKDDHAFARLFRPSLDSVWRSFGDFSDRYFRDDKYILPVERN